MAKSGTFQEQNRQAVLDLKQQKQLLKVIAVITLVVVVPLGIKNIVIGELMLGFALLAFEISLLLEVTAIIYKRQTFFNYYLPVSLLIASAVLTVAIFGNLGTYWIYPIVLGISFLLPKNEAIFANTLLICAASIASSLHLEWAYGLRYFISLVVTAILTQAVVAAVRKLHVDMHDLLIRDAMTGAYNRHELSSSLEDAIEHHTVSSIAIIDLDRFKYINDYYGHDAGDKVLMKVVAKINHFTADSDKLFRLGGDEFLILFRGKERILTEEIMNYIAKEIRHTIHVDSVGVTISVGVAESQPFQEVRDWMKHADLALYKSKQLGRDKVSSYTPSMEPQQESSAKWNTNQR